MCVFHLPSEKLFVSVTKVMRQLGNPVLISASTIRVEKNDVLG